MPLASPNTLTDFADRVREAQEARGLSDQELATAVPTNRSHLYAAMSGRLSPLLMTLWRFGHGLRVSPTWLAFGDGVAVPEPVTIVVPHQEHARASLAARVRFARRERKMTCRELALAVGFFDASNISGIENGRTGTKLHVLRRFADALDVPGAWLMDVGEVGPWD